jgi:predicted nucleic acid-binding protein
MIVIDASVIVKWIKNDEADSQIARLIYFQHKEGKEKIIVPQLLFYEVANYLATKTRFSPNEIKQGIKMIFQTELQLCSEEKTDLVESAVFANKYNTSVYDMLYAVIAKKQKTILITADERFIQKTKFPFVKLLSEYKI